MSTPPNWLQRFSAKYGTNLAFALLVLIITGACVGVMYLEYRIDQIEKVRR